MVSMWDPRGTLKTPKPSRGGHQKRDLKKNLENVVEKGPFLTLWSCQNHVRVFKNRLFPVSEKVTKKSPKSLNFGGHFGSQILQNPILGGPKKTAKKCTPKVWPTIKKGVQKVCDFHRKRGSRFWRCLRSGLREPPGSILHDFLTIFQRNFRFFLRKVAAVFSRLCATLPQWHQ